MRGAADARTLLREVIDTVPARLRSSCAVRERASDRLGRVRKTLSVDFRLIRRGPRHRRSRAARAAGQGSPARLAEVAGGAWL